jgi:hypothetical protein
MFRKAIRLVLISLGAMTSWTLSFLKLLPAGQRADAADNLLSRPVVVDTPHGKIRFLNHSRRSFKRARTILTKEPDSLTWIDRMEPGSVFFDIGANVGVLTLYAATRGDIEVWAFEPAAVNYYNLVANCELTNSRIEPLPTTRLQRSVRDRGFARIANDVGALFHFQGKYEARSAPEVLPLGAGGRSVDD